MKIAVFTYTFGTIKTEAGLHHLVLNGFKPCLVLAAPPVPLNFYHSRIRIAPKDIRSTSPKILAKYYEVEYAEGPHNSEETCDLLRKNEIDVAVILGSRIIKQQVIDSVKIGILNMHPGKLPDNRGLDNVKWAILLNMVNGATAHLINNKIDLGRQIHWQPINVYEDDTLMDIHLRVQDAERMAMIQALTKLENGVCEFEVLEGGIYRQAVTSDIESGLSESFLKYKNKFSI